MAGGEHHCGFVCLPQTPALQILDVELFLLTYFLADLLQIPKTRAKNFLECTLNFLNLTPGENVF